MFWKRIVVTHVMIVCRHIFNWKLQKIDLLALSYLSICTQQLGNGFSWNLVLGKYTKTCQHIPVLVQISQQHWAVYMKAYLFFVCGTTWLWIPLITVESHMWKPLWWHHHPARCVRHHPAEVTDKHATVIVCIPSLTCFIYWIDWAYPHTSHLCAVSHNSYLQKQK
jgi:hypothetical protein